MLADVGFDETHGGDTIELPEESVMDSESSDGLQLDVEDTDKDTSYQMDDDEPDGKNNQKTDLLEKVKNAIKSKKVSLIFL